MVRSSLLAGALLVSFGGSFLRSAWQTVVCPWFAEAMEGDVAQTVERVAAGQPPYVPATAEAIPLAYHPLHYYLAAGWLGAFGNGMAAARAVSALTACWSAACVGWWARRKTGSRNAGCVAAALFCVSLRACDGALFTALPDSTMLAFVLTGWLLLDSPPGRWREAAAMLCFAAAFWTKQHGALYFGSAVAYAVLLRNNAWPRLAFVAALAAFGPGVWWAAGRVWPEFRHFTFNVPSGWERKWGASAGRFAYLAAVEVPFAAALAIATASWRRPSALGWFVGTSCVANLFTMSAAGSSNNHYIPTVAGLCVLAVVAAQRAAERPATRLPWLLGGGFVAALGMTAFAARKFPEHLHAIPLYAPFRAAALGGLAWAIVRRTRPEAAWPAAALAAQFGVALCNPRIYAGDGGDRSRPALASFGRTVSPDGRTAWIDYGSAPLPSAWGTFGRWPSWVVLEDVSRAGVGTEDLEPFRAAMRRNPPPRLLSANCDLPEVPGWREFAGLYGPPEDFGSRYAACRQIAVHWYSDQFHPRYLFHLRKAPEPRGGGASP